VCVAVCVALCVAGCLPLPHLAEERESDVGISHALYIFKCSDTSNPNIQAARKRGNFWFHSN